MYKILLVEDEKETAAYVREALELENMEVDVAYNGLEGLEKFHQNEYDLILLDLLMPKMSGEELIREIRKENPYIDIIVYTNLEKYGDLKKLVNLGINGYVNKGPGADLDELLTTIKEKLEPLSEADMINLIRNTDEI